MKLTKLVLAGSAALMLVACAHHGGRHGSYGGGSWGSYKCIAKSSAEGGKIYKGWSVNSGDAKDSALHKCKVAGHSACHIVKCVNEA